MAQLRVTTACKILSKQNKLSVINFNNSMQVQNDYSSGNNSINSGYELLFTELFDKTDEGSMHDLCMTLTELRLKKLYLNTNSYILYDISKIKNLRF
jgi:hypothetical protein